MDAYDDMGDIGSVGNPGESVRRERAALAIVGDPMSLHGGALQLQLA